MTPQERDVITGIFERLKQAGDAPRDAEAEKFIADMVARQPYAPYVMAQSVYVHEQAVANLQAQVEQLQAQLREAQAAQSRPQQSGGFLSGLFGGAPSAPAPQRPSGMPPQAAGYAPAQQQAPQSGQYAQAAPQQNAPSGPWGSQQQAPAGGGFLRSAVTTAAGVAGGMVLGNVLMNAFSGGGQAHAATPAAGALDTSTLGDALNGKGDQSSQAYDDGYQDAQQDADLDQQQAADDAYQDAQQDASFDDDGFDDGGDGWA